MRLNYNRTLKKVCSLIFSVSLSASCSGSVVDNAESPTELAQRTQSADRLVEKFRPIVYSDLTSVPTTGNATYAGYALGVLSDTSDTIPDNIIGKVSLQVDFGAESMVSGIANDFLDSNGNSFIGQLSIFGGNLDRMGDPNVDPTFVFNANGDLMDQSGRILQIISVFQGDFLGETASGIGGDILGSVIVAGINQRLGGLFILEMIENN